MMSVLFNLIDANHITSLQENERDERGTRDVQNVILENKIDAQITHTIQFLL